MDHSIRGERWEEGSQDIMSWEVLPTIPVKMAAVFGEACLGVEGVGVVVDILKLGIWRGKRIQ